MSLNYTLEEWTALSPSQKQIALSSANSDLQYVTAVGEWDAPYPNWPSGYEVDSAVDGSPRTTSGTSAGNIRAYLFPVPTRTRFDALKVNVLTASASSTMRVGLYTVGANWYPKNLVVGTDAGLIDMGTTGVKTSVFSTPVTVPPGWYFIAYANSDALASLRGHTVNSLPKIGLPMDPNLGPNTNTAWAVNYVYAPLPSTFPENATAVVLGSAPNISFRVT